MSIALVLEEKNKLSLREIDLPDKLGPKMCVSDQYGWDLRK